MTRLRFLLVLVLVPVVIVATPGVGNAANYNDWHRLSVQLSAGSVVDVATNPLCDFAARYDVDGAGVAVGAGKCSQSGLDVPGQQLTEPGAAFEVEFKGLSAGESADYAEAGPWVKAANSSNPCVTNGRLVPVASSAQCTITLPEGNGTTCWAIALYYFDGSGHANGGGFTGSGMVNNCSNGGRTINVAGYTSGYMFQVCGSWDLADRSSGDGDGYDCGSGETLGWVYWPRVGETTAESWPPTGSGGGAGAGEACSAVYSGTLAAHADDGTWGIVSTLPAGAVSFGQTYGACHVTEVCVTLTADHWGGTSTASGCSGSEWGAPWEKPAPEPGDVDELAPVPDALEPVEQLADEPSFWSAILEALASVGRAIGGIAKAILDGLTGLFVPSDGFMEAQGAALKDAWSDTPPLVVLDGVQDLGDSLVIAQPPGDCAGPALDFTTELTGPVSLSPLSTCREQIGTLASIIKTALTVVVYVGAFLAGVRIIGSAFGVDLSMSKGGDTI